jgi:flagellar hook protein FlgE
MDVIGNNIANVDTVGFKKSRVVFKDALYQSLNGGSAPTDGGRGGTNPQNIGLGVTMGSIDTITTGGTPQSTGKNTDLAIDGNGYFILGTGTGTVYYTRAGNFDFDELGNYVSPGSGLHVMGWMADRNQVDPTDDTQWRIDTTGSLQAIDISSYKSVDPQATSRINFDGNFDASYEPLKSLDGGATVPNSEFTTTANANADTITSSQDVYDSLGNKHTLYFQWEKIGASDNMLNGDGTAATALAGVTGTQPGTVWRLRVDTSNESGMFAPPDPTATPASRTTDYYVLFDANGKMTDIGAYQAATAAVDDDDLTWNDIYTKTFDPAGTIKHVQGLSANINVLLTAADSPYAGAVTPQTIKLNFADTNNYPTVTQANSKQSAGASYQDGFTKGDLESIKFDQSGTLVASFSNGVSKNLARVALATFQNPSGLSATGGNLFQTSPNSGQARVLAAGDGGAGVIDPAYLESSNVDLSEEFTDMIITERGFQANSRTITTSDEMLQELLNLKRG